MIVMAYCERGLKFRREEPDADHLMLRESVTIESALRSIDFQGQLLSLMDQQLDSDRVLGSSARKAITGICRSIE